MRPSSSPSPDRPRRFYKAVGIAPREGGFTLLLDGRGAKTPAGSPLVVPTEALARLVAAEWDAQAEQIDLSAMPANRLAATVIDRTAAAGAAVAAEVARYAGSDAICYFAEAPATLVEAQVQRWGPLLDWARDELGVELHRVAGVIPRPQPDAALARVEALAAALEPFAQAGVRLRHGAVRLGGPGAGAAAGSASRRRRLRPLAPGAGLPGGALGRGRRGRRPYRAPAYRGADGRALVRSAVGASPRSPHLNRIFTALAHKLSPRGEGP